MSSFGVRQVPALCRYRLAESLDAQLKRMSQDLKEIIDRINSSNAKPDTDSPVSAVTRWNIT